MKSFKYLLYLFFILNLSILNINAKDLTPTSSLLASGGVIDLVLNNDKLYGKTGTLKKECFDESDAVTCVIGYVNKLKNEETK